MLLNTLSKTKAREYKMLASKKERDRQKWFLAEGEKCVLDTLDTFDLEVLITTQDWIEKHPEIERKYHSKILVSDKRGIEIISSLNSLPDVIAVFHIPSTLHSSTSPLGGTEGGLYLALDEIQDPGNLGTIIRTCDWFGVYDIFASKNTVDVYSPKVVQATMGSLARVKVHYLDLLQLFENNPEIPVIGTVLNGKPYDSEIKLKQAFLLMGNEGRGISEELRKRIDLPLTIPPANPSAHPDSLNVAIATAILLSKLSAP